MPVRVLCAGLWRWRYGVKGLAQIAWLGRRLARRSMSRDGTDCRA